MSGKMLLRTLVCTLVIVSFMALTVAAAPGDKSKPCAEKKVEKIIHLSGKGPEGVAPALHGMKTACQKTGGCAGCCDCCGGSSMGGTTKLMHLSGHGGSGHGMHGLLAMAHTLDLTDKQMEQLKEIKHATKLEMVDLEAALSKARLNLNKLIHEDAALAAIKKELKALMDAQYDLKLEAITSERAIWAVLTDEQREKLESHGKIGNLKWFGKDGNMFIGNCGTAGSCMSLEKCITIDDESCGDQEIEVFIEEGSEPGEKKVIIKEKTDND